MIKFFILLIFIGYSSSTIACDYFFSKENGEKYPLKDISIFISKEVRSQLNRKQDESSKFNVFITRDCDGKIDSVKFGMISTTLYILQIQDNPLPEIEYKYTDDQLHINYPQLEISTENAINYKKLSLKEKQDTLKFFAFIIAESARFEEINKVSRETLNSNCEILWKDYAKLLRSWKLISIFSNSKGLIKNPIYIGGFKSFLVAPVTIEMIEAYNSAIINGWQIDDDDLALGDIKKSSDLALIGSSYCPN